MHEHEQRIRARREAGFGLLRQLSDARLVQPVHAGDDLGVDLADDRRRHEIGRLLLEEIGDDVQAREQHVSDETAPGARRRTLAEAPAEPRAEPRRSAHRPRASPASSPRAEAGPGPAGGPAPSRDAA